MIQANSVSYFFTVIIVVLIFLIIYFNSLAAYKYDQGLKIIPKENTPCKYSNLPSLKDDKKTSKGLFSYQSEGGNYYTLGTSPVFYHTVCKKLCGGGTDKNGECSDNKNPKGYQTCIDDLQPQGNCKNSAVPLVKDDKNNDYYAQEVFLSQPT